MAKINKMYYYTAKGEKKINRYYITLPKQLVEQMGLQNEDVDVKIKDNKIIIEKN